MRDLSLKRDTRTADILRIVDTDGPCSAQHIAQQLDITRAEVNSILYRELGTLWLRHGNTPPKWYTRGALTQLGQIQPSKIDVVIPVRVTANLEPNKTSPSNGLGGSLPRKTVGNLEILLPDGTWKVTVFLEERSRNDPLVSFEKRGPQSLIITVSTHVSSNPELISGQSKIVFDDGVFMAVTSAVAWSYLNSQPDEIRETADFGLIMRDVYLAAAVAARSEK